MGNSRANELLKELARLQTDTEQVRRDAKNTGRTNVELFAKGAEGAYADALARVSIALPTIIAEAMENIEPVVGTPVMDLRLDETWAPGELTEVFGR